MKKLTLIILPFLVLEFNACGQENSKVNNSQTANIILITSPTASERKSFHRKVMKLWLTKELNEGQRLQAMIWHNLPLAVVNIS
jgi:hypothetical protein